MKTLILHKLKIISILIIILSVEIGYAQNETPSSHVSVVIAPIRFQHDLNEDIFLNETGSPNGQQYITLSLMQTSDPGLSPSVDLLDHIERVDGSYSTGVLLHTSHGGSAPRLMMECFKHATDATALAAAQARLTQYGNAGWDIAGADREIEITQHEPGWWSIWMFDRAITNRGTGLATDKPLVLIVACYGELMCPAYTGKGARVALGTQNCVLVTVAADIVKTFFERMNGREGQVKRPVSAAKAGLELGTSGAENTTLAPSVTSVTAPCPIKVNDVVTFTLETTCEVANIPDIVGGGCTIENEVWLSPTTLQGTCTSPPPPGSFIFTLTLKWGNTYSDNNTARLDGNTNPGINAHGPAHDDYIEIFSCLPFHKLYYVSDGGTWDNWDIYTYDLETNTETRLTFNAGIDNHPVINHVDTGQIAFSSNRDGEEFDIYIADVSDIDGTATRLTFNDGHPDRHPHWHPNGHQIVFSSKDRACVVSEKFASECSQPVITHEIRYYEGLNLIDIDPPMTTIPLDIHTAWDQLNDPGIWIPHDSVFFEGKWYYTDSVYIGHPSFNHQGDMIVFSAAIDGQGKNWEVYTVGYNPITRTLIPNSLNRVTFGPNGAGPSNAIKLTGGGSFSYDDTRILFNSTRTTGGNSQIFSVPATSSNVPVTSATRHTWTHGNDYVPEDLGGGVVLITSDLGFPVICPTDTLPGASDDLDVVLLDSDFNRFQLTDDVGQQTLLLADEVSWFCGNKPNLSKCTFQPRIMSLEALWLEMAAADLLPQDLLVGYDPMYTDAWTMYGLAWLHLSTYLNSVNPALLLAIMTSANQLWTGYPIPYNEIALESWLATTQNLRNDKFVVPAIMYNNGLGEGTVFDGCNIEISADISLQTAYNLNDAAIDLTMGGEYWHQNPPYLFSWSNGENTEDISGLAPGTYSVFIFDAVGCTRTAQFTIPALETQVIPLDLGWNLISLNVHPMDMSVESIFGGIMLYVEQVKGMTDFYLPPPSPPFFNTLQSFSDGAGYWVKVSQACTLQVVGTQIQFPFLLELNAGWNLIGYPGTQPLPVDLAYNNLMSVLQQVKNTTSFYFPPPSPPFFNTLHNIEPGFGYWISVALAINFYYTQTFSTKSDNGTMYNDFEVCPYKPVIYPNSTSLIGEVTLNGLPIDFDAFVGAFVNNECRGVGKVVFEGNKSYVSILVNGTGSESLSFRLVSPNEDIQGDFSYQSLPGGMIGNSEEPIPLPFGTVQADGLDIESGEPSIEIHPNPFNGQTTILLTLKETCERVGLTVYDSNGKQVKTLINKKLESGTHKIDWDGTNDQNQECAVGIYHVRMFGNNKVLTQTAVVIK